MATSSPNEAQPSEKPAPPKKPSRIWRIFLRLVWHTTPFVFVGLALVFLVMPMGKKIAAQKTALETRQKNQVREAKPLTNVVTLEMTPHEMMEKISLPGVARPWKTLQVVAEVSGKIVVKKIEEGSRVKKGDILAVIDKRDYQNTYDSAKASYETARTSLNRFKALSKNQFVTQSQLDEARSQVKTAKAAMGNAKLALSRCAIRSPMNGIVDRAYIENGSFLGVGDPVAKILQINKLKIEVGIPESDVAAVRKLKHFDITIDALNGKTVTGTYHYLYKTTDSLARLYSLEIALENPDFEILPDMFSRVAIVKARDPEGLGVPMYALLTRNNVTGVFVERDSQARFQPIAIGFQDGWETQVTKGLSPGEHVVVVGHLIIDDGEKVNVIKQVQSMEEINP